MTDKPSEKQPRWERLVTLGAALASTLAALVTALVELQRVIGG
ncbi:hypothetical protein ACPCHT_31445 [Nucisporomicrobium flavum]|jgi:hypothetical protein|nr:hypothetical protein [Nucisporomicrobium flavum]